MSDSDIATVIQKGKGRMPAFPLPAADIELTGSLYPIAECDGVGGAGCRAMRRPARRFFSEAEQCSTCHVVRGRGTSNGPDLSNIASRMRLANMQQALANPSASITPGYAMASVRLNDGTTLRGFLRAQGSHDVVLQTRDGKLHPLVDSEYQTVHAGPAIRHGRVPRNGGGAAQSAGLSEHAERGGGWRR